MAAPADPAHFKEALIILGAAAVVVPLFQRLRVSSVLGFMLVGVVVGPFGIGSLAGQFPALGWLSITQVDTITLVAELGVVMLMFMIGLEMSFDRLRVMRRLVFGLGPAQVVLCAVGLSLVLAWWWRLPMDAILVVGTGLAMSSTAVVVQVLSDSRKLAAPVGRLAFAVLLLQDLAVVPVLFAVDSLSPEDEAQTLLDFVFAMGKAGLAIVAIFAAARLGLRPLFRMVARTRSPESFMAACLLVILGTALATAAAGLSMAVGSLLAGLLLAETEYRRQIEVTIEPFKGLLLGVFLLSVGMMLDLRAIAAAPWLLLSGVVLLLVIKIAIITPLARYFAPSGGQPWRLGLRVALLLAPGGEFGFVILSIAYASKLIPPAIADPALIIVSITMAMIPLLYKLGTMLEPRATADPDLLPPSMEEAPRVLIAGFGRVGQTVGSLLERHGMAYVALDSDADRVGPMRRDGRPVFYGDMTRIEMLRHLDVAHATALVITLDNRQAVDALVALARKERPDLLIVARARDAAHAARLYSLGASDAVPETVEASLQLGEAVLVDLGVPMGRVIVSIHEERAEYQAEVKSRVPDAQIRRLGRTRMRDMAPNEG
jgi:monovalent cation:H+ antiporter-2, CPA2 family